MTTIFITDNVYKHYIDNNQLSHLGQISQSSFYDMNTNWNGSQGYLSILYKLYIWSWTTLYLGNNEGVAASCKLLLKVVQTANTTCTVPM